jgi:hypothetical protein
MAKSRPKTTCPFKGFKHWYQWTKAPLPELFFQQNYDKNDWRLTKRFLKHKSCPRWLREEVSDSPIWYKRLVACLTASADDDFWYKAAMDSDKRVRRAAIYSVKGYPTSIALAIIYKNNRAFDLDPKLVAKEYELILAEIKNNPEVALFHPQSWVRSLALKQIESK